MPCFSICAMAGVVEIEAVLDGVASAVEGAVQSDAAVGVAGDFLAPAVGFVDDGLQFFDA